MSPILTNLCHFRITLRTWPDQRARTTKDQTFRELRDVNKNRFICLDYRDTTTKKVINFQPHNLFPTTGNNLEVRRSDAAPRRRKGRFRQNVVRQPQHWRSSTLGRVLSTVLQKELRLAEKNFSKISDLCLDIKDMIPIKMKCLHLFTPFSTVENNPVD